MPKIRILDDDTVSKIAAGEVIERPASVVKELVENSIDAGATRITVETANGGKSLIRVTDNGSGMAREDAVLSLRKHATSKLRKIEDLGKIRSLGFRGEALSSICAVADVELVTKPKGGLVGTFIACSGGNVSEIRETGCPDGTSISVKSLFSHTPARLKHLRPDRVELAHTVDAVSRYALARPETAFRLLHDGTAIISTAGSGRLPDAIMSVYGRETAGQLMEIEQAGKGISVRGYISIPSLNRSSADGMVFFVNGRSVRSPVIGSALREAYGELLPKNRYPFAVLFMDIDPAQIDVNVHPAKTEIRFARQVEVCDFIAMAGRSAIASAQRKLVPDVTIKSRQAAIADAGTGLGTAPAKLPEKMPAPAGRGPQDRRQVQMDFHSPGEKTSRAGVPRVLGLAHDTYAVLQDESGIMIMDQHAAHERILYEEIGSHLEKGTSDYQELLAPVNLDFTARESTIIEQYRGLLEKLGFSIEQFGRNTYSIRSVPSAIAGCDEKAFIHDVVDDLIRETRGGGSTAGKELILKIVAKRAATAACRKAVKAGDATSTEKLQWLVSRLFTTKNPYTCPHGRPTLISITKKELERKFGRI